MIDASSIFSVPESGGDLDSVVRRIPRVRTRIAHGEDGPSLRVVATDTSAEILRTGDEAGPEEFDLKAKIEEWRAHVQDYATGAGFRKAHRGRGPIDPRRFALQLSTDAFHHGQRHHSGAMVQLARRLKWVSRQKSSVAARALERLAEADTDFGRSRIEKPQDRVPSFEPQVPSPPQTRARPQSWQPPRDFDPDQPYVAPGAMETPPADHSWESERLSARRRKRADLGDDLDFDMGDSPPVDADLVQHARKFLNRYISTNSLNDDQALPEQLAQPDLFESWIVDLDSKGVIADPEDLDLAWNQAISDMTESSDDDIDDEPITSSRDELGPSKDPFFAPGGDWANTVIPTDENPQLDRYLRRESFRVDASPRVSVTEAADQLMDHVSGEMTPSEISADHVRQFVEREYPDVPWKKVYAVIETIADPHRRHDEKERDTSEIQSSNRGLYTMDDFHSDSDDDSEGDDPRKDPKGWFPRGGEKPARYMTVKYKGQDVRVNLGSSVQDDLERRDLKVNGEYLYDNSSPFTEDAKNHRDWVYRAKKAERDGKPLPLHPLPEKLRGQLNASRSAGFMGPYVSPLDLSIAKSPYRSLRGKKEICACCRGTGEGEHGTCTGCAGSGRDSVDLQSGDLETKKRVLDRVGTLLLVAVAGRQIPTSVRREFGRITGTRVASAGVIYHAHSTALMQFLRDRNIPFRTASYRHPGYHLSR